MPRYKLIRVELPKQHSHKVPSLPKRPSFVHPALFSIVISVPVGIAGNILTESRDNPPVFMLSVLTLCVASVLADYVGRYVTFRIGEKTQRSK